MADGHEMLRLLSKRQSDRRYLAKPVENEKLERILEAGRISPSACNGQPWKFIVVDQPELRNQVALATKSYNMNTFVDQAPLLIVVVREKSNFTSRAGDLIKQRDYSIIDIGIATASIVYQATAEGLGTCIVGWFDEKEIQNLLKIPKTKRVEVVITVGYTDGSQRTKIRKPVEEVVSHNHYK